MRRFIGYAKTLKPKIPVEVGERIIRYYVDMRDAGRRSGNCVSITQRQQEALYRFTEASAKINLRGEATLADAENAIEVISYGLEQVGVDPETGNMDVDALYTGIPKSMGEKIRRLPEAVHALEAEERECYFETLVDRICKDWGIKHPEAEKLVNTAVSSGLLFRPRIGIIKVS
jgi:replicative DNA helicase Mcm